MARRSLVRAWPAAAGGTQAMHAKSIYLLQSAYLVCISDSLMAVPRLERYAPGLAPLCVTRNSMLDARCSMLARDAIIHLPTQADYACVVSSPALVSTVLGRTCLTTPAFRTRHTSRARAVASCVPVDCWTSVIGALGRLHLCK